MKIGKTRIAVLIGKNGETKRQIENDLGVKINLDSKTGYCDVQPVIEAPNYNPLNILTAEKIIRAVNRGFNPSKAIKLAEDTYDIEIFNLFDILGKSEKKN